MAGGGGAIIFAACPFDNGNLDGGQGMDTKRLKWELNKSLTWLVAVGS